MPRVILIIIDGCRPDALQRGISPHIDGLLARGAHTLIARTVQPPITLPAHFSIFTSQSPIGHNVLTNTGRPDPSPSTMSLMEWLRSNGKSVVAVYCWEHLRNLAPPGAVDIGLCINANGHVNRDAIVAQAAGGWIREIGPDFTFVYLEGMDMAGHAHGWMSDAYLAALETADQAVGMLLEALPEKGRGDYIILHSDHGGVGYHHQSPVDEVMTIPWIIAGPSVRAGHHISVPVTVLDTAPTITYLLGLPLHFSWEGRPVMAAFADNGP